MKKYIIYTDLHRYAAHEIKEYDVDYLIENYSKNTILTGDILDAHNVSKHKVKRLRKDQERLKEVYGVQWIYGNHLCCKPDNYYIVRDNVVFLHYHTVAWPAKKVLEWEEKKAGKGKFSRAFYRIYKVWITGANRNLDKKYKMKVEEKEKIVKLCKRIGVDTACGGHHHAVMDEVYKGIRIVVCKRGKTEIEL